MLLEVLSCKKTGYELLHSYPVYSDTDIHYACKVPD